MDLCADDIFPIKSPDLLATRDCNMACKYCFEPKKLRNSKLDADKFMKYMSYNPARGFFPFGGEPLLVLDFYIDLIKKLKQSTLPEELKKQVLKKTRSIITNGTLIKANLEKIKKHKFYMQISFDGPKHVHDQYRVFPSGKGTYDIVMDGIMTCVKNNIPWSIHGVVAKDTIKNVSEIFITFFEIYHKYKSKKEAIGSMKRNNFQIIFEDEYDDNDIDVLLQEFHKIADWIYTRDYLTDKEKNELFDNYFTKHGGVCSSGASLMAIGADFDIYPCHRLAARANNEIYKCGNIFDPYNIKNKQMLNIFTEIARRKHYLYSSATNIYGFKNKGTFLFMWCPATNMEESGNPYFQPAKYNVMFTEVNRFIEKLREVYYKK